ncbi:MAG: PTS sugar transporter subunit IIA [Candidatus Firestonebacteria bacterium]
MVNVLVVSHGSFAKALLKTAEMIIGKQANAISVSINTGEGLDELRDKMNTVLKRFKGEVLILSDMCGGSPSLVSLSLVKEYNNVEVIVGVNLPVLLEVMLNRDKSLKELAKLAVKRGLESIGNITQKMNTLKKCSSF